MKSLRYVVSLAFVGAALTIVPAVVQQSAAQNAPAAKEPTLLSRIKEGARGSIKVSTARATGQASSIRAGRNGDLFPASHAKPAAKADAFLRQYSRAFGAPRAQLVRDRVATDKLGYTTVTYVQRYHGVPVFGSMLRVHLDRHRNLTSVNGVLAPVKGLSLGRDTSRKEAAARAVALVRAQPPGVDGRHLSTQGIKAVSTKLVVYRHGLVQGIDKGRTELAYQVTVSNNRNVRDVVFVTANAGKVINRYSLIDDALFRVLYEASLKPNGTIQFKKVWQEGQPQNKLNTDQKNMEDSTQEAYWFFHNAFNRDSYDDAGHQMVTVNNDPRIDCPNANWNGSTTNYCDGVSSDDVVAHEWGHAYTEFTDGLLYQWQPGAMNEAYSDIWGETIDLINGRQDEGEGDIDAARPVGQCSTHSSALPLLTINAPAAIAKDCLTGGASFGAPLTPTGITGDVALAVDTIEPVTPDNPAPGTTTDGCSPYTNAADVVGKIVMVDRGYCSFQSKADVATAAGAIALIIGNRDPAPIGMSGDGNTAIVSTVSIGLTDREAIRSAINGGDTVNVTIKDAGGTRFDSYRWLIGEKSDGFGGAIRDMWAPTCYGDPGKVSDAEYKCSEDDNGGVHGNSGVVNHSYALLVDGGTYNNVAVTGIGLDKAANIYYRAQTEYLTPVSGFPELADALEDSCDDLVGQPINQLSTAADDTQTATDLITSADCAQVTNTVAAVELRADPTGQCGFGPLLQPGDPATTCGAGTNLTTVFSEDFEDGLAGWDASSTGNSLPWQSVDAPAGHGGKVAKGPDPDVHCATQDPTGADFLASGDIVIPADGVAPKLSFDQYIATEAGFDGGNVQLSVNGSGFTPVPAAAYTFNAPTNLTTLEAGNANPLAGQPGFSGSDNGSVFGTWGTSQVDLAAAGVAPGDTIRIRIANGRDSCTGNDGWYVDDIAVVVCTPVGGPTGTPTGTPTVTPTVAPPPAPTTTPTTTPPVKAVTVTKVKKPKNAPTFKQDFKIKVTVTAAGTTPKGRVVLLYKGVKIGKGKLVKGKVTITVTKNLNVGKQKLVAKYKGSPTTLKSKKRFTITIVA